MKSLQILGNLNGRLALVTGGAGNIGTTICETLAEAGAKVIILDLNKSIAEKSANKLNKKFDKNHIGMGIDLSKKNSINQLPADIIKYSDSLDILVNCASLVGDSKLKGWATLFEKQDYDTFEKAIKVNLTSVFYIIQQCKKLMENSESPSIINIGSIYGFSGQKLSMYDGTDYLTPAAYTASKGGIIQLTRYLSTILAPKIRVNCISPGGIEHNQSKTFINRYKKLTPLKRMGKKEDLKGIVHFLASDLSSYITGQNIIVDGGWSL